MECRIVESPENARKRRQQQMQMQNEMQQGLNRLSERFGQYEVEQMIGEIAALIKRGVYPKFGSVGAYLGTMAGRLQYKQKHQTP